jgi:hypothetical protein
LCPPHWRCAARISDIAWGALETERGVELILSEFPHLEQGDTEAVLPMCTILLLNLEAKILELSTEE